MSALPNLETLTTPALLIDGPILVQNVADIAARAEVLGVQLWPHSKTHKSRAIARLQREHGAAGLTVATLREAECFADAGVDDLLIAYPPVGEWRLDVLSRLAVRAGIRVVVDGPRPWLCWTTPAGAPAHRSATCGGRLRGRSLGRAGSTTARLIARAQAQRVLACALRRAGDLRRPRLRSSGRAGGHSAGARLRVIPNHACATANLHTHMLVVEGEEVADVWSVDARGWDVSSAGGQRRLGLAHRRGAIG